jgi:hypothetical protein
MGKVLKFGKKRPKAPRRRKCPQCLAVRKQTGNRLALCLRCQVEIDKAILSD